MVPDHGHGHFGPRSFPCASWGGVGGYIQHNVECVLWLCCAWDRSLVTSRCAPTGSLSSETSFTSSDRQHEIYVLLHTGWILFSFSQATRHTSTFSTHGQMDLKNLKSISRELCGNAKHHYPSCRRPGWMSWTTSFAEAEDDGPSRRVDEQKNAQES